MNTTPVKALLLGLSLTLGAALAQTTPASSTPVSIPALPPSATPSSATSTAATSTAATSVPAGSVILTFAPKPGTSVTYKFTQQSQVTFKSVQLLTLPGKKLTARQEKARQQEEARLKAMFSKQMPTSPAVSGTLHIQVLPLLTDGSRVLDITEDISVKVDKSTSKNVTVRMRQTVHPDGKVDSVFQNSTDPIVQKLGASLNDLLGQTGSNVAGNDSSLFGRPLAPGQLFKQSSTLDFGQYLSSVLSSAGGKAQASGQITTIRTTTYQGMDARGQVRIRTLGQFTPTTIKASSDLGGMTFKFQSFQVSGQTLLRPDGLLAGRSDHTTGDLTLSFQDDTSEPYQTSFTLYLDQTNTLVQQ